MQAFVMPQVPGSIPRSQKVDGVLEAVLRKKYVAPLVWVEPCVAAGVLVTYLTRGRFDPAKNAVPLDSSEVARSMWLAEPPLAPTRPASDEDQKTTIPAKAEASRPNLQGRQANATTDSSPSEEDGTEAAGADQARLPAGSR